MQIMKLKLLKKGLQYLYFLTFQDPPARNEGAVGEEDGNNLRQGVNVLMEAMRDLLANIRPMDPPLENQGGNADEERDEEEWD